MTRILLTVEYDGTDFFGWQIQPEKRTVQGELETALSSLLGEKITLKASGRTDAGVHALEQKAHFDTVSEIPADKLCFAVNVRLPRDVSVRKAEVVPDDFEARFSAKKKTYEYRFYFDKITRPLIDRYAARVPYSKEKFDEKKSATRFGKNNGNTRFFGVLFYRQTRSRRHAHDLPRFSRRRKRRVRPFRHGQRFSLQYGSYRHGNNRRNRLRSYRRNERRKSVGFARPHSARQNLPGARTVFGFGRIHRQIDRVI